MTGLILPCEFCMVGGVIVEHCMKRPKEQFICSETRISEDATEQIWYGKSPEREVRGEEVHINSEREGGIVDIFPALYRRI